MLTVELGERNRLGGGGGGGGGREGRRGERERKVGGRG